MDSPPTSLKGNVIGLLGAATMGVVMLSPAMTLYGNFGPSFLSAGKAAPLAFLYAFLATIPTAISYVMLAREYPDSGSAASWAARAVSPRFGVWGGWIVFLYYFFNFTIQPVTLGVFTGNLFALLHVAPSRLTYSLGVLLCGAWPAWMVYRGISLSARGALFFLLVEAAVVVALCLTILWVAPSEGGKFGSEGFQLHSSPGGASGILRAMVFAMLAYCGFDVVSTLAEEARMARRLIPLATVLSLLLFAVFIIAGVWCLTYGSSVQHLKEIAERGQMPITELAVKYWGRGSILVTFTAISATLGLSIATAVGASRILFSMGRSGLAARRFASLHPRYQVPWSALHLIFVGGVVAALGTGALLGPYNAFVWWGTTSTFFAMLTYILVNLSHLVLFLPRAKSSLCGFFLHAVVPVLGLAADGFILIRSFFIELWRQGWATGQSVIVVDVACAVVALIVAGRRSSPPPPASLQSRG